MELKDRVALITGGARIGRTVAEWLAGRGCHIVVTWRASRDAAVETVQAVERAGVRALAFQADLGTAVAIPRVIQEVDGALGRLDILINMASVYRAVPLDRLDAREWDENLNANLRAAYLLALAAAPLMRRGGGGRIINVADWTGASGRPRYKGYLPYYVSKKAVIGLTESLALELAPEILVNAIAPGPILPPPGLTEEENREVIRATPAGRWGGADEIAKAVLFLVETDFVTGECLRVDGGRHLF